MSKAIPWLSFLDNVNPIQQIEAFSFLERCHTSQFDLTYVEAISSAPNGIPSLHKAEKITDEQARGRFNGSEEALNKISDFFQRKGFRCSKQNVSFGHNILSTIESSWHKLKIWESKILVPIPTFGYFFDKLEENSIPYETFKTNKEDGFLINPVELEKAIINSGAKFLLLCYPNNPTGVVMTRENAEAIATVVQKHNIFVISDEAFMENSISNTEHFSLGAIDGMLDRSLTITSPTKSFGIRGGYKTCILVGPPFLIKKFAAIGGYVKASQTIVMATIEDNEENRFYHAENRQKYLNHIDFTKAKISQLNQRFGEIFGEEKFGIDAYVKPYIETPETGGPYLLDFSGLRGKIHNGKIMETGLDSAKWLLENASFATVPGECFFLDEKEMVVRIAISRPTDELEQAFNSAIEAATAIQNPLVEQNLAVAAGENIIPSGSPTASKKSLSKVVKSESKGISSDEF